MTESVKQDTQLRRGWIWLVIIGMVVSIIGIIVGSQKAGSLCGSVFSPQSHAAELFDTLYGSPGGGEVECRQSIAGAAVPTWILIVLGIVVALTGIVVRSIGNSRPVPVAVAPAPSVATQVEELARLHQQGSSAPRSTRRNARI